ncbi:unnamed protein product [Rotaria sordida]|uniref:Glycoside hydrolase family 38 N-terminal domain-containing protein n=1 Tax=Rotaria sordida TaxID=392033 RepID=A0A815XBA8_9BILA|nr:unnamed protein product [Rotaria sordida]CAF1555272.1 unnamed protein product [Rotaria sordida]
MLQSISINRNENQVTDEKHVRQSLDHLQESIQDLDQSMKGKDKEQIVRPVPPPPTHLVAPNFEIHEEKSISKPIETEKVSNTINRCIWRNSSPVNTTFEIRQLYNTLPFDDEKGGVWTQGFDITYDPSQWTSNNKLKIILMPHSHCDPGWIHTFEGYFQKATKYIIDNVITILNTNKKYKFVWAEMSYLSLWWDQASFDQRELFKKLTNNKQLEIVTGGWILISVDDSGKQ